MVTIQESRFLDSGTKWFATHKALPKFLRFSATQHFDDGESRTFPIVVNTDQIVSVEPGGVDGTSDIFLTSGRRLHVNARFEKVASMLVD